ncbi:hypothetical protein ACFQBN_09825 [Cohnella cellulosilytica]
MDAYRQAESEYANLPMDQAYEKIRRLNTQLKAYQVIVNAAGNPDNPVLSEEIRRIKQQSPTIMEAFANSGYNKMLDKLSQDTYISELLLNQYEAIRGYKDYLQGIQKRSDEMLGVSIFQDAHSFSYRNIVKTPKDFVSMQDLPLQPGPEWGIVSATTFSIMDGFMVLLLFLLCIYLFQYEKDSGIVRLIRSTAKGRFPLVSAKLVALISMSVILTVFFYGIVLLLAQYLYGLGDLSRYVQSMEAFRFCNLPLTVGQYLVMFFICKIVANILVALAISVLFQVFSNVALVYGGLLSFFAWQYLSFRYIHPLSSLQLLKYINVFSFYDAYGLLAVYKNLNIGGYPVWYPRIMAISALVLILLLTVVCITFYMLKSPIATTSRLIGWMARQLLKLRKPPSSVSLLRHEWYKQLFTGKMYIILALALLIGYQDLNKKDLTFNEEDGIYNRYMDMLEGSLNQRKISYILEEQRLFDDLPLQYERIMKQYGEGGLSPAEYMEKKGELDLFSLKERAFSRVYSQYQHLVELKETRDINGSFLNELTTNYLFGNAYRDLINGLIYTILLVASLSVMFPMDYQNGMVTIIRGTRKGRLPLFLVKHVIAVIVAMFFLIVLYMPAVFNTLRSYPAIDWGAPIQSMTLFGHLKDSLSVLEFACGVFGLQISGAMLVCACTLYLSILVRKRATALLVASIAFVIPFVIQLAGLEEIHRYTFSGFFVLFGVFTELDSFLALGVYTGLLMGVSAFACILAWLKYTNPDRRKVRMNASFFKRHSQKLQ